MANKSVGVLTIGQSPRPDLVAPLLPLIPDDCQIIQAGALDGLTKEMLPAIQHGIYPLATRMRDGNLVMVEELFLTAKLQEALDQLENQGVVASILLCAGTFAELNGKVPLFKPFSIGRDLLRLLGFNRLGLISPIKEQEAPIHARWHAARFQPTVWTANLANQDEPFNHQLQSQIEMNQLECIVLDYVGHPQEHVARLKETAVIPIIDLGQLAIVALTAVL